MGFKEDIEQGQAKLGRRREELLREITAIDAELKDYDTALRVAKKLASPAGESGEAQVPPTSVLGVATVQDVLTFDGSMKDLITEILKVAYPRGMDAANIRHVARKKYAINLNPNTLTVSLGRLKASGDVRIVGRVWYYTPKKDAPPEVTGGASISEGSA